jgi:amidase
MGANVDASTRDAVMKVAGHLESLGHHVEEASPVYDETMYHTANLTYWCGFLAAGVMSIAQLNGRKPSLETLEATTLACVEHALSLKLLDVEMADAFANMVCRSVGPFFVTHDVLLTPTTGSAALPLGFIDGNDPTLGARGWYERAFRHAPFTALYNMTGQPAVSLPLCTDPSGLPLGMQLVGGLGAEDVLIRLASQLEVTMPWAGRRPKTHVGTM